MREINSWQFATAFFNCGQLQTVLFKPWDIKNSSIEILVHLEMSG